jgi:hypothetical protein
MGAFFLFLQAQNNPLTYENTTYKRLAFGARALRL